MTKIRILSVRDPQWANGEKNAINCIVLTSTSNQEEHFTAKPDDCEAYCREVFTRCLAGEFGEIAPAETKTQKKPTPHIEHRERLRSLERFLLEANKENSRKSFRSVVILWGSLLENLLDEMLETEARRIAATGGTIGKPPSNFQRRIEKALKSGLIDQEETDKLLHIKNIRNATAHEWDLSLDTEDVLPGLQALHEADHSDLLVFHKDLDFLIQQVYSSSCAMLAMKFTNRLFNLATDHG
jgi:hypothetical protein